MNNFNMELTKCFAKRYFNATKKEKGVILDEYCKLVQIERNTAVQRLKRSKTKSNKRRISKSKRGRKKVYRKIHKNVIKKAWKLSGNLCAELMYPELEVYLNSLKKAGELNDLLEEDYKICKQVSLGTLKIIIAEFPNPNKRNYKSKSHVYKIVPIDANFRRFTKEPGNIEIDYVEHNGGYSGGRYAYTGTYVDLFSQWTVRAAGWGKNLNSFKGICEKVLTRIYHPIYRVHPDNCQSTLKFLTEKAFLKINLKNIEVSRSRPYKKNDNAHVEQKNGDKVRKQVGHWRLDTQKAVNLLNEFYSIEDLICNFFTPCMKLHCKMRNEKGKIVKKIYQKPATPYDRLIRSKQVSTDVKKKLIEIKNKLDIFELRRKSDKILNKLKEEMH